MRVPNPEAQAQIDAINRRLDRLREKHRRVVAMLNAYDAEIRDLQRERGVIYHEAGHVEVDAGKFGHSPFARSADDNR